MDFFFNKIAGRGGGEIKGLSLFKWRGEFRDLKQLSFGNYEFFGDFMSVIQKKEVVVVIAAVIFVNFI